MQKGIIWNRTREVYARKTQDVLKGRATGKGMFVPVYAFDLEFMLEELKELEALRARLGEGAGT